MHRTVNLLLFLQNEKTAKCARVCESFEGSEQAAAAHSLLQQSPASLWQIDAFLPSSSQTDEFVSCNKGPFCFFVLNKAKYHCCLSLQHSAVYFTPPAMDISQEDKLPYQLLYSLLAAPQITSAYVYTPYFKSQTTPRDCLPSFAPAMHFPLLRKTVLFFYKLSVLSKMPTLCFQFNTGIL